MKANKHFRTLSSAISSPFNPGGEGIAEPSLGRASQVLNGRRYLESLMIAALSVSSQ
jgi:hypothetical protein